MDYDARAEKLLSFCSLFIPNIREEACNRFPQLLYAERLNLWGFFGTVLAVYTAIIQVEVDVNIENRDRLHRVVIQQLRGWNESGPAALDNLDEFVQTRVANLNRSIPTVDHLIALGGTWMLWNITDKKPIADEIKIASMLGNLFVKGMQKIWTKENF